MRLLLLPILLVLAPEEPAVARALSGPAVALDGDSLDMSGLRIRLFGIDAPEAQQQCQRNSQPWACGKEAQALLASRVAGTIVECEPIERDAYDRTVARCFVGDRELGSVMVAEGLAITLPNGQEIYASEETTAKQFRLGLWGSVFQQPAEYRAANPQHLAAPPRRQQVSPATNRSIARASVWYRNCAEARAAGAAPLYRGRPGYRPEMDGDGDGVACEPYRGRR
jgi:endonuclease YncB( thermonuclease family)